MPEEIDPSWPPPIPKPSQTAAVPSPQETAPWPPPSATETARVDSVGSQRPPWQRPGVVPAVLAAVVLVAAALTISVFTTRSNNGSSAAKTTAREVTTSSAVGTSSPPQLQTSTPQPSESVTASSGHYPTIVDYIKQNGITEAPVHRGDPVSPTINLPFPPGWEDAENRTPQWAYGEILATDPAMAQDPPTIISLVSKLTGNVDPAKILEYAPNEIKNLPGFEGATESSPSTLGGFDAIQIGGTYTRSGVKRAIAQKTVVIPGQDGLYVLQLNADGTEDQTGALIDATSVIDEQATITR
jgi:hypothetical protein